MAALQHYPAAAGARGICRHLAQALKLDQSSMGTAAGRSLMTFKTQKNKPSRRAVRVDVLACICVPRPLCNVNYALRWKQTSEWECRERHVLGCSSCLSVIGQVQLGCIYCCHSSVRPSRNCFSCVCKTRLTEVARDQPYRRPGSV